MPPAGPGYGRGGWCVGSAPGLLLSVEVLPSRGAQEEGEPSTEGRNSPRIVRCCAMPGRSD
jgi:hypothetical protein